MIKLLDHYNEWHNCTRCPISNNTNKHVLFELIPKNADHVDILMIGEGPGKAEDLFGRPFIGPSGRLLRETIKAANQFNLNICLSNLIACRPSNSEGKNRAPTHNEIINCSERLVNLVNILNPKVICCLGSTPHIYIGGFIEYDGPIISLPHPAYILRTGCGKETYKDYYQKFYNLFYNISNKMITNETENT